MAPWNTSFFKFTCSFYLTEQSGKLTLLTKLEREQNMAKDEENAEFVVPSAIRAFHVCRRVWVPRLGQRLCGEREHGNTEDRFAVAALSAK